MDQYVKRYNTQNSSIKHDSVYEYLLKPLIYVNQLSDSTVQSNLGWMLLRSFCYSPFESEKKELHGGIIFKVNSMVISYFIAGGWSMRTRPS